MKKVLAVEDDADYRKAITTELGLEFDLVTAEDGQEAVDKILTHHPDVILLDLLLPKLDGFEVLRRLRSYPDQKICNTPVVVLSNLASPDSIKTAQELKVSHYFVKSESNLKIVAEKLKQILLDHRN